MEGIHHLAARLEQLDMHHYLERLVHEGFTSCQALQDATEQDLELMGILLNDRMVSGRHPYPQVKLRLGTQSLSIKGTAS